MSNPFDQFASDFQAGPPPSGPGVPMSMSGPSGYGAPPSGAPMNAPPTGNPPPYGGGGYGAPPGGPFGYQTPQPGHGQPPPPPGQGPNPFGDLSAVSAAVPQPPPPVPMGGNDPFASYGQLAQEQPPSGPSGFPGPPLAEAPPMPPPMAPSMSDNPFASMGGLSQPDDMSARQPPIEPPQPPSASDPWGSPQPPQQISPSPQQLPFQQPQGTFAGPPGYGPPPQLGQPQLPQSSEDPNMGSGALVAASQQSNPYALNPYGQPGYGQQPPPYGQPPQYGQPAPYGQQASYGQPAPYGQYQQPPPNQIVPVDPFSVFEAQSQALVPSPAPVPTSVTEQNPSAVVSDDDFWGGFGPASDAAPAPKAADETTKSRDETVSEEKKGEEGLPSGGEWYDARIFTPTLGVMFFKPQELTDSLFLNTDSDLVEALGERPTVAFIVEGSSARAAGVELGHVLVKVNGVDVKNPKEASRMIKEGPRPLPLLFYVPNTEVVVSEGEHMVKYDTKETTAPNSAKEWKPKYVVIGGIISQPWMMNMYRSKSEYDIAVIETQARRPVSVKVKQFSLQGARVQNDWQGPQMVKYKNNLHPWKYIVVLPVARNPIKISSPNLQALKPVHEGIRRVLLAQQRDRGSRSHAAGPVRDDYSRGGESYGHSQNGYDDYRGGYDDRSGGGSTYDRGGSGGGGYDRGGSTYDRGGGYDRGGYDQGGYSQPQSSGSYRY